MGRILPIDFRQVFPVYNLYWTGTTRSMLGHTPENRPDNMLEASGLEKAFGEKPFGQLAHVGGTGLPDGLLKDFTSLEMLCADRRAFERLTLLETQHLLDRLNAMQHQMAMMDEGVADGGLLPERKPMLSAIFRLSADLSEHLMARLMDQFNDKQHSIDYLQQELSRKLRDQNATSRLLRQTQALRVQTQRYGEALALGNLL